MAEVRARVKNAALVAQRRNQIIDAAVSLFSTIGFQKTTTRLIAQKAGISIGSLYEYINSKEDLLYLICESIHLEMAGALKKAFVKKDDFQGTLANVVREYFYACDRMSDQVVLMYKITQFLQPDRLKKAMASELDITNQIIEKLMSALEKNGGKMDGPAMTILGHNVAILGQMWAFRRWFFAKQYTLERYIDYQTQFIQADFMKQAALGSWP